MRTELSLRSVAAGLGWPGADDGWRGARHTGALGWPLRTVSRETPPPRVGTRPPAYGDLPAADGDPAVSRETRPDGPEPGAPTRPVVAASPVATSPRASPSGDEADTPIAAATAAALQLLRPRPDDHFPRPSHRRVVAVANQKGGVGKTTSAVNLAAAMAIHGLRVLVVDLDPQGNASTGLGVAHHSDVPSIYDVLLDGRSLREVAQPVAGLTGLCCAPANIDLAGAEIELVSVVARESRLRRAIEAYRDDVDYLLIDCPPSLGLLTVNALVAAEEVLIPIQCEYYALEGLSQLLTNIELVREHLNAPLRVSTILLTMYDARTRLAEQVVADVRTHFGETVLDTMIPRSVRVSEAPGYGESVLTYDPGSRGAAAYRDAAREIACRAITEGDAS